MTRDEKIKIKKKIKSKTVIWNYDKEFNMYMYECVSCTNDLDLYDNFCSECGSPLYRDMLDNIPRELR